MLGQHQTAGQKAIGPTLAANVGPMDVLMLGQCWPNVGMLSGLYHALVKSKRSGIFIVEKSVHKPLKNTFFPRNFPLSPFPASLT